MSQGGSLNLGLLGDPDVPFHRDEIQRLLYGPGPLVRFTQDTPILPDVWIRFGMWPGRRHDLLLTPNLSGRDRMTTGQLAATIRRRLEAPGARSPNFHRNAEQDIYPEVAYNQSSVVVRVYFDELLRAVLPISSWWYHEVWRRYGNIFDNLTDSATQIMLAECLADELLKSPAASGRPRDMSFTPDVLWMIRVAGTIAQIYSEYQPGQSVETTGRLSPRVWEPAPIDAQGGNVEEYRAKVVEYYRRVIGYLAQIYESPPIGKSNASPGKANAWEESRPMVHQVSLNRPARLSVWRSTQAVKADAARNLFDINCSQLNWAVIDDGIDARHIAFRKRRKGGAAFRLDQDDWSASTRVMGTYDFTKVRSYLSTEDGGMVPTAVLQRLSHAERKRFREIRRQLFDRLSNGLDIDWSLLLPMIEIPHTKSRYVTPRRNEHGTHVAGILAGDWRRQDERILQGEVEHADVYPVEKVDGEAEFAGVCRDINLYDLRVFDQRGQGDEFSVMAALQFVRYLNSQTGLMNVHGVNLSLSMLHDVTNYACGRTPICLECDRLIGDGIVVVAAAGNEGWKQFEPGLASHVGYRGYEDMSITDPGNAAAVITVGSTHRNAPHDYGVSYFSSRGPTGDGRIKPDLVAPGEKIVSCTPNHRFKRMDGTSMSAPHVSGACALLMARHGELIGKPQRIKEILCNTATDLGRERYFQGFGMVDVLRALQSI